MSLVIEMTTCDFNNIQIVALFLVVAYAFGLGMFVGWNGGIGRQALNLGFGLENNAMAIDWPHQEFDIIRAELCQLRLGVYTS